MAQFEDKTWVDRVSEQPQRRLLTPTDGSTPMTVDVTRQEGLVVQEGDVFSANNMNDLEQRIKTAIDANDSAISSVTQKANTNQENLSTLSGTVTTLNGKVTTLEGELTANGKRIYMDYKNGKYGYNLSASRGADTFFPFRQAPTFTRISFSSTKYETRKNWLTVTFTIRSGYTLFVDCFPVLTSVRHWYNPDDGEYNDSGISWSQSGTTVTMSTYRLTGFDGFIYYLNKD